MSRIAQIGKAVQVGVCMVGLMVSSAVAQVSSVEHLEVRDANGAPVGKAEFPSGVNVGELAVVLQAGTRFFWVQVHPSGFQEPQDLLGFQSGNCTGAPFIFPANGPTLFSPVSIVEPGNTLYLPVEGSVLQPVLIGSILRKPSLEFPSGCIETSWPTDAYPAQAVVNLDTVHPAPFSLAPVATHVHRSLAASQTRPNTGKRALTGPAMAR